MFLLELISENHFCQKNCWNQQYGKRVGWLGFYGISTIVGYLIPNSVYTYIEPKISKQTLCR